MSTSFTIPSLTTERLVLRAPAIRDLDVFAAFHASDRTAGIGGPMDRNASFRALSAAIGHWHLRGFGRWLVADQVTDAPLGIVGLYYPEDWPEPEIAWSVFDGAEGRGIAYEAALASRRYAYDTLGWSTLVSLTDPNNTRSIALAQRMGAVREDDYNHPEYGPLMVWRHLSADVVAA